MPITSPVDAPFINRALPDLASWTARLQDIRDLPILATTSEALEFQRHHEESADANGLGELIARDPLMTLKVLACVSMQPHIRPVTDIETVTATLVMMGISPFFRAFGPQPAVEERLSHHAEALAGLVQVLQRARHAANLALAFSAHRADPSAPTIHAATLLHDFAELLLWCHAPELAVRLQTAQADDTSLPPGPAQRRTLNIELSELQRALMTVWRLPQLLGRVTDERQASRPDVRCVQLAVRVARHSAPRGDASALPADFLEIGKLLNLSSEAVATLVQAV